MVQAPRHRKLERFLGPSPPYSLIIRLMFSIDQDHLASRSFVVDVLKTKEELLAQQDHSGDGKITIDSDHSKVCFSTGICERILIW